MSVIELAIHAADDPLGTPLVTLTDEDVATFEMRVAENSLGAGAFTIRRSHAAATAANLAEDNYVTVTIPAIDPDPIFGFFLEHQDDLVLAQKEEGAETLTRQGPGALAIVGRAAFLDLPYAPAPPATDDRGSANEVAGYWRWQHKQYGQILVRLLEEGQSEPGTPLADVTFDFDRNEDSDGTDWPTIDRDVRFEIGTDGLTFMERFAATGEVFIRCSPDLLVSARQARGTDRTASSFGAGKVRLVKGTNIQTELRREGDASLAATHALVLGMELSSVQVVSPSYVSGPGKWATVHYDNSNDPGVLAKVGLEALARGQTQLQAITLEIKAGDDEANGRYLPFKHFDVGDLITVHTGSGANDYDEQDERINAFTIALREATDDTAKGSITGDEMAARSLIVGVECGGEAGTFGIDLEVKVQELGCGGCVDPPRFDCEDHDYTVRASGGGGTTFCVVNNATDDQACVGSDDPGDVLHLYNGATYRVDYLVFHAPTSTHKWAVLSAVPGVPGFDTDTRIDMGAPGLGTARATASTTFVPSTDLDCRALLDLDPPSGGNDNEPSSISATITYLSGPDPRFEGLEGCANGSPFPGQQLRDHFEGDGSTTTYILGAGFAYRPRSLRILVDGLDWSDLVTESDPSTGEYVLAYEPPLGATVRVEGRAA